MRGNACFCKQSNFLEALLIWKELEAREQARRLVVVLPFFRPAPGRAPPLAI